MLSESFSATLRFSVARIVFIAVAGLAAGFPIDSGAADVGAQPLSLDEALRIAADQSSQLAAQRHGVSAAEQAIVAARELPDPKLFFGVDNLPVTGPDQFSLTQDFMTMRKIGVMQDFPRAQKRELKGQLAERIAQREKAMLVDVRAMIRRDVATAWIQRYYAQRMSVAVGEQVSELELQLKTMQAGLRSNKTQPAELLGLEISLQSLLDRQAEWDKQAGRARAVLSRWLGEASARPLAGFALPPLPTEHGAVVEHIDAHPHVQSLDRQINIAKTEADLARVASKPDWSLELSYAQRGPAYSNMVSVQVSIDLPLFQAQRRDGNTAAKLAQLQQAMALKEDAVRQHLAEAQAAWADWEAASARLKRFDESLLPLAHKRINLALAAYRGGRGELTPVLDARRTELDLRLQQLQLSADQGLAYAQLLYFLPGEPTK